MTRNMDGEKEYPQPYQARLRRLLAQRFKYEELSTLAFDLGIDPDHLAGQDTPVKARELVAAMKRAGRLEELVAAAERERPKEAWPRPMAAGKENPYKSLSAFGEEDEGIFFGREAVVARLKKAMGSNNLTAVIGPSGSGKSSVVFAGLVPELRRDGKWLIVDFRPGSRPVQALASAVLPILEPELKAAERLQESKYLAEAFKDGRLTLSDLA